MSVEKYGWVIQENLFPQTNQRFTISHTHKNSKMLYITWKYFSSFSNKTVSCWNVDITTNFLACYFSSYYISMDGIIRRGNHFFKSTLELKTRSSRSQILALCIYRTQCVTLITITDLSLPGIFKYKKF